MAVLVNIISQLGGVILGQVAHADVGIDAGLSADVGSGLAADAGELGQLLHRVGQPSAVLLDQHLGHGDDVAGLGFKQAAGFDHLFHLLLRGVGEVRKAGIFCKQVLGDDVDPRVGALGGKPGGNEQLEGAAGGKRTERVRIPFLQPLYRPRPAAVFSS